MILWCLDVPTGCSTEWYKLGVAALTFKDHHFTPYRYGCGAPERPQVRRPVLTRRVYESYGARQRLWQESERAAPRDRGDPPSTLITAPLSRRRSCDRASQLSGNFAQLPAYKV